ncbi:MAG: secretin N-terminal domain-containing protein [Chlamydiota bacterium]
MKQKLFYSFIFLGLSLGAFSSPLYAKDSKLIESFTAKRESTKEDERYTINYNNVSILEYLKFVSKISSVNFLFNSEELQFPVTVISKEPLSASNIMATLLQILRIHGFSLLEQDGNLVIHKNDGVKQMATIVGSNQAIPSSTPIVTRLFRIRNANVESVAAIVRPMISKEAILEVSASTRHLILTDVTANIKKIEELIEVIDASQNPLEIEVFKTKMNPPEYLIGLANQIMTPLTEGSPFHLIAQDSTNSIYIVSTPRLIEKATSILTNLDTPTLTPGKKTIASENIFVYKALYRPSSEIEKSLENIAKDLEATGYPESGLLETIHHMKWIKDTNSFLFTGNKETLAKIKEILSAIDTASKEKMAEERESFFMYKPSFHSAKEIIDALNEIEKNLSSSSQSKDLALLRTLESVKLIETTHTLLFTGDSSTFGKLKELLTSIDGDTHKGLKEMKSENFFLYEPQHVSKEQIQRYLEQVANHLDTSGVPEKDLIQAIKSLKWMSDSHSFMFVGTDSSLRRIKELLTSFDSPAEKKKLAEESTYFLYKLQHISGSIIEEDLERFTEKLKGQGIGDPRLIKCIEHIKWVKETNSILITGPTPIIEEVKDLIVKYDVPRKDKMVSPHGNFFMYKPLNLSASVIEKSLKDVAENLQRADLADPNLINAINSLKYIASTNSLVFTGNPDSIEKIQSLLKTIDIPGGLGLIEEKGGKATFFLYQIRYVDVQTLLSSLQSIATDLKKAGSADGDFLGALASAKYQKNTNSLLFTGTPSALDKIHSLLEKFDLAPGMAVKIDGPTSFIIYKPRYLSGPSLESALHDFSDHLKVTGFTNEKLYASISSMKWDEKNNQLIFTGDTKSLDEIKGLLATFDLPSKEAGGTTTDLQPIDNTTFLVYKLQYHKGDEIQGALKKIGADLTASKANVKDTLLQAINSIQWIEITNSLLCSGDQETMTRLRELIRNMDIPLKQVFIEMLVIQTSLTNVLDFGLEWGSRMKYRNKFIGGVSNFQPPPSGKTTLSNYNTDFNKVNNDNPPNANLLKVGGGFDLGVIGDIIMHKGKSFLSLGSLVTALKEDAETVIMMTPKIIAQDSKTATLFIGNNIPYLSAQTNTTGGGTTQAQTQNLDYQDIGMSLTITPFLGNAEVVTLAIDMENSAQITDAAGNVVNQPVGGLTGITTSKTSMNTTVNIPNKNFLILTGMVQQTKNRARTGIPCLGSLPLIGAAFSQNSKLESRNNLVIFIRPHIINSYKDMISYTDSQEELFRENAGTKDLERDFDEGIDLIKSTDGEDEDEDEK